jgi:fatty acid desaturase
MQDFKKLEKRSAAYASIILLAYVVQIVAAIIVGRLLMNTAPFVAFIGMILLMLFIGTRFRGVNNIVHECSHAAFTANRLHNETFGKLAAAIIMTSFEAYKIEHMTHHAHLGDYERDLDFGDLQEYHLEQRLTAGTITRHVITPIVGLHLPKYCKVDLSVRDGFGYGLFKVGLIFATILFALFEPVNAILLLLVPFLWIYPAINYWTDCIDHGGLLDAEDEIAASRNFILPRPLRFILFPRNDCYHLIHHLFPTVPVHHFDRCHKMLLANQDYRRSCNVEPNGRDSYFTVKAERKGA